MIAYKVTSGKLPRLLAYLLVLSALLGPGLQIGWVTDPVAAQDDAPALDLAAMVLTPDELAAEGLSGLGSVALGGITSSGWASLGDAALDSVAGLSGSASQGQLIFDLDQTGWKRQYRLMLARPDGIEPDRVTLAVALEIAEFTDAAGADEALTLLMTTGRSKHAKEVVGTVIIGDRTEIRRDQTYDRDPRLVLTFRVGRLLAAVKIVNVQSNRNPELETIEAVARRFLERIESVIEEPKSGLSQMALRLSTPLRPAEFDQYWRRDGATVANFGETAEGRATREAHYGEATDVYGVDHTLPPAPDRTANPAFYARLYRFPDEHAAAAWLADTPRAVAASVARSDGSFAAEPIAKARTFGDESLTYSVEFEDGSATTRGYRIYVRVGAVVARIQFEAIDEPPLVAVEQLAAAQTACLLSGSCPLAVPIPSTLPGLYCAGTQSLAHADPEAMSHVGTAPIGRAVPMRGGDPARTGVHAGPGPKGDPEMRWRFETRGEVEEMPLVADGVVFAGDNGSLMNVTAVDAATGAQTWCATVGSLAENATIAGDLIVFDVLPEHGLTLTEHTILALDRGTGVERWRYTTDGSARDMAAVDESVYLTSLDGGVLALDAVTGKGRWRFQVDQVDDDRLTTPGSLAVADGVVYVAADASFYALDAATGDVIWRVDSPGDDEDFSASVPTVADGIVYVRTDKGVRGLDAMSGEERWWYAADGPWGGGIAVADGRLYLATGRIGDADEPKAILYAVDLDAAQEVWRYETAGYVSVPAVVDGVVYAGTGSLDEEFRRDGAVLAFDAESGEVLWREPIAGLVSAPAVIDGLVYVGYAGRSSAGNGVLAIG